MEIISIKSKLFLKLFVLALIFNFQLLTFNSFSQGIAINTDGSNADNSAMFDIKSTTRGILVPRMTLAQRALLIGSDGIAGHAPETSCLIYQTDNTPGYYYYNGTAWTPLFSGTSGWALAGNTLSGTEFLGSVNAQPLIFKTNNTEWMRILSTGNIGIGQTNPSAKIEVSGNNQYVAYFQGTQTATDGVTQYSVVSGSTFSPTSSTTNVAPFLSYANLQPGSGVTITNAAGMFIVQGSQGGAGSVTNGYGIYVDNPGFGTNKYAAYFGGKVGIGTATPSDKLHVFDGSITAENSNLYQKSTLNVDGGLELYRSPSGLTPEANGYVDFKDNPANDFDFRINFTNPTVIGAYGALCFKSTTDGTSATEFTRMVIKNENGYVGIATINPQYTLEVNGTTACLLGFWSTSDVRYKKDINPITSALNNVLKIQGVTYHWRKDEFKDLNFNNTLQYGVIAQELEKIFPELVNTDTKGYKSVDYAKLTPVLVEAIKEQQKIIANMQSVVANQQIANDKLKADVEKIKQQLGLEVKK
ncbi:MAG TPA: hypothetical protein DEH02_07415 [Bacteroidales bacterium]|nr:MAG: hypothetical protein A2X01_17750 [Bacteroidetes bacterium GWF2_35_48]HBX50880.1 hypothetical protein [Bacteroidales bacterium]